MYRIVKKQVLNPTVTRMEIEAPLIAKKAEPGQFIILRVDENGERIPLTVADFDREAGTVTIIFQIVGATTEKLNHLEEGDSLHDFVGPLGRPSETEGLKIPHMGWNTLKLQGNGRLFRGLPEDPYVYFVHSYYLQAAEEEIVTAVTDYGIRIHASVEKNNVFACQFHPEKSSSTGLAILKNFVEL